MNPDNARTFRITAAAGTELAGPYSLGLKGAQAGCQASRQMARLNRVLRLELAALGAQEEGGTRGVAVKCIDITKTSDCEGSCPVRN